MCACVHKLNLRLSLCVRSPFQKFIYPHRRVSVDKVMLASLKKPPLKISKPLF